MTMTAIGVDFGTTNSVVALADAAGNVTTRRFETPAGTVEAYRSALLFFREGRPPHARIAHVSGPVALDRALDIEGEHRFLQSLKSHLSSRAFQETRLFGRRFQLEDLIATFLGDILPEGREARQPAIVSGRPVVFAGDRPDEALAVRRLGQAYALAGMKDVGFAFEPLGAAYWYARGLKRPETVLVADFGGGTSDFSVMRFTPGAQGPEATALSHAGIGIAGDSFDFRILDHIVSPQLGKGQRYNSLGKLLPMPAHYHAAFAQWHRLSLMKSAETLTELHRLALDAEDPARIEALIAVIENDLGYALYRAVSAVKTQLSEAPRATFSFHAAGVDIEAVVERAAFEAWIAPDIAAIAATVDTALDSAGLDENGIDAVFITGGTSYVPAVRALFNRRFGTGRLHYGDAFNSVASGLALYARDQMRRGAPRMAL